VHPALRQEQRRSRSVIDSVNRHLMELRQGGMDAPHTFYDLLHCDWRPVHAVWVRADSPEADHR
jgi:hypothetical protein